MKKCLIIFLFIQNIFASEPASSLSKAQTTYLQQTTTYLNNLTNTKKMFLSLLLIALIVFKRDKLFAWLVAIKHYLAIRKLEYCTITIMGLKLTNFILHNRSKKAQEGIDPNLLQLPGETFVLNLKDIEHYSDRIFGDLISAQHQAGHSFILAKVITNNSSWSIKPKRTIYDCNATNFHHDFFGMYKNNLLSVSFHFPFDATFYGNEKRQPMKIEQVCYFEITKNSCKYLGSSRDLNNESPKQKEMTWSFIKAMTDLEVANWLLSIEHYYINHQGNLEFNAKIFEYLEYFAQKYEHAVFAKYLKALVFANQKNFVKAKEILDEPELQNLSGELLAKVSNLSALISNQL
ncbi:MAG: hypothetical protein P4L22_06090 [Candidatus Babeliales bacterium]|nr:hypothetical protein [Candidatus Babeliales bacterium]